jgi:hypothetical protein
LDMVLVEFQTQTELKTIICGRQVNELDHLILLTLTGLGTTHTPT